MHEQPLPPRFPSDDEVATMAKAMSRALGIPSGPKIGPEMEMETLCRITPLGKFIVAARERHGLTARAAAHRAGLKLEAVQAIETSGVDDIVPALVERYADFLGVGRYLAAWRSTNPHFSHSAGKPRM